MLDTVIRQMLERYQINSIQDKKNAMKEILQEAVLCGLSRAGFFKIAAFYGGSALRIFYNLDRFSEDLDFSLMTPNLDFDINKFLPTVEKEINAYGLNVDFLVKEKTLDSTIKSAFLKANTKEHLLLFYPNDKIQGIATNEVIKIKFEIDICPPPAATYERKYYFLPAPFEINLYDKPSLFAGKLHAVLCRNWQNRIKGRDLYDFVFYVSHQIPFNLPHLRERMIQTGHLDPDITFDIDYVRAILNERFQSIDFKHASRDVLPFLRDSNAVNFWSSDFFRQLTEQIQKK